MRHQLFALLTILALVGVGCRSAEVTSDHSQPFEQPRPVVVTPDTIPAGADLQVQLNQKINSKDARPGDHFTATLLSPLVTADGETVVPAGANVIGAVTGVKTSERIGDQAAIKLDIQRLEFEGESYPLAADIVDTNVETPPNTEGAGKGAAIGGVAGAALGAVIGGSLKGALIGGVLGAGTGSVISLGTGNVAAELPAGSRMTLRTTRVVRVD